MVNAALTAGYSAASPAGRVRGQERRPAEISNPQRRPRTSMRTSGAEAEAGAEAG
jgi:hypothetical protein